MADLQDLEKYVDAHPADHEQRWRLAKKLYRGCEYERVFEHLEVLQRGWHRKLNLMRDTLSPQLQLR